MILKTKIPEIYHDLLADLVELNVPDEKLATCNACNLCVSPKSPFIDLKCCNYFPYLPNFLVGGILADEDPSLAYGKQKIRELIATGKGVTPYGIIRDKKYKGDQDFFLSSDLPFQSQGEMNLQKCPYYHDGNCSVWKYREHLCVSFFCSSIAGKFGDSFWKKLDKLMKILEQKIMHQVLINMGWTETELFSDPFSEEALHVETAKFELDVEKHAKMWKTWSGREVEFFIEAFQYVQTMPTENFDFFTGVEFKKLKNELLEQAVVFREKVYPELMQLHPDISIEQIESGVSRLKRSDRAEYYDTDTVFIPFIQLFDGTRTTNEVFKTAYKVIFSMNNIVDELIEREIFIPV